MSAPISPKTVKFDDQLVHNYRSGSEYSSSATSSQIYRPILNMPQQSNMTSFSCQTIPISLSSGSLYQQQPLIQTSQQNLQEQFALAAGRVGLDMHDGRFWHSERAPLKDNKKTDQDPIYQSGELDEVAMDLLRLSTEPAIAVFNNRPRQFFNEHRLQKAASTSSMPKRTELIKVHFFKKKKFLITHFNASKSKWLEMFFFEQDILS